MNYKISTNEKGIERATFDRSSFSNLQNSETNDCVVRSISSAFNLPYDESHQLCKALFQRKNRDGVYNMVQKLRSLNGLYKTDIEELGMIPERCNWMKFPQKQMIWDNGKKEVSYTTGSFLKEFKKGRFILLVNGHMFTVVDGVVFGNYMDAIRLRKIVNHAFEVGANSVF